MKIIFFPSKLNLLYAQQTIANKYIDYFSSFINVIMEQQLYCEINLSQSVVYKMISDYEILYFNSTILIIRITALNLTDITKRHNVIQQYNFNKWKLMQMIKQRKYETEVKVNLQSVSPLQ